ncbi:hypothetical protein [Kamptonema formosum]|uniref:hypothetical protein n=1 Tax=Kamptonema formosum TaxID=331992 RepID=UPI000348B08E|nr:hypothetical protein [Oscillatoria sp. PCC 10802]
MPATAPQVKVDEIEFFLQSAGDLQQDGATGHKVQLPRPPATPPWESPRRAGRLTTRFIFIMPATAPQVKVGERSTFLIWRFPSSTGPFQKSLPKSSRKF